MPRSIHVEHPEELRRHLSTLSREDLEHFAQGVFDALYLSRRDDSRYDPDREWNADTFETIYGEVQTHINAHPSKVAALNTEH